MPERALAASEVEANLKAMLMGGMSTSSKTHEAIGHKMYVPATQPLGMYLYHTPVHLLFIKC